MMIKDGGLFPEWLNWIPVDLSMIKLAINLDVLVVQTIVSTIIIAPSLWIAGRIMVGKDKALLSDAIWIVAAGQF